MPRENPFALSESTIAVALSLIAAEANGDAPDLNAIATAAGIPVEEVSDAVSELLDAQLVETHGRFGGAPYVTSKPILARALEGALGYSPAVDDQKILTALLEAGRDIMVEASELGRITGLDPRRTSEAVARLEHDGMAEVLRQIGRSEYSFTQAAATARARRQ